MGIVGVEGSNGSSMGVGGGKGGSHVRKGGNVDRVEVAIWTATERVGRKGNGGDVVTREEIGGESENAIIMLRGSGDVRREGSWAEEETRPKVIVVVVLGEDKEGFWDVVVGREHGLQHVVASDGSSDGRVAKGGERGVATIEVVGSGVEEGGVRESHGRR